MSNEELAKDWKDYGVVVEGEVHPIRNIYMVCWGWSPHWGGLVFDVGGPQPGVCHVLRLAEDGETLLSVNPSDHDETIVMGKVVKL